MKHILTTAVTTVCATALLLTACAENKAGAQSPEALFNKVKATPKSGKLSSMLSHVVPSEKPVIAFSMEFMTGYIAAFKPKAKPDVKAVHEKYNIPQNLNGITRADMQKPDKVRAFIAKRYEDVDLDAFINDLEAVMDKFGNKKQKEAKGKEKTMVEMSNLQKDGDKATADVKYANGNKGKIDFLRENGRWYLSMRKKMKM